MKLIPMILMPTMILGLLVMNVVKMELKHVLNI